MPIISVKNKQTVLDLALEHCGNINAAITIARLNNLSLSSVLNVGQPLTIPDVIDKGVVRFMTTEGQSPATAISEAIAPPMGEGIGYWVIGVDFEVQ